MIVTIATEAMAVPTKPPVSAGKEVHHFSASIDSAYAAPYLDGRLYPRANMFTRGCNTTAVLRLDSRLHQLTSQKSWGDDSSTFLGKLYQPSASPKQPDLHVFAFRSKTSPISSRVNPTTSFIISIAWSFPFNSISSRSNNRAWRGVKRCGYRLLRGLLEVPPSGEFVLR
jgi:hypothetical protein